MIVSINSDLEKRHHFIFRYDRISSNKPKFIGLFWVILYDWWSTYYNSSSSLHGWLLYLIALIVSNFCFLTQFIKSHGLLLVIAISWILLSKKNHFANLIIFLYLIQSNLFLEDLYKDRFLLQLLFYQALKYLVMQTCLACLFQSSSTIDANLLTISSKVF